MNFLFLSVVCFVGLLFVDKSFGIGVDHDYENDLSLLLSNGMRLGSFRDSLHKVESKGHKISSFACTSDCDSSCNDDCDSCNTGCDSDCDSDCDGGCDFLWWSCDNSCNEGCDSDCDDSCDSESCDSGCTEGCDETCGDEDTETEWLAYMDEFGDHIGDRMIDSTSDFKSAYSCYNNDSKSDCSDEYVSVYENYLSDALDDLQDMIVDDSYSTGLSLSVGFVDDDDSTTVFIGILQTDNQTFFYVSESDEIVEISNNDSYFGAIGFYWDYSDIESTNYFESQKDVNISGCDWSMGFSMIFNQDTLDWVGMIYGFAYDEDDDDSNKFVKQTFNLTNVDTALVDITDYVSDNSSSSSSSSSSAQLQVNKNMVFNNDNDEWMLSNMIDNISMIYILSIVITSLIIYIISLKFKMNRNKELEYRQLY